MKKFNSVSLDYIGGSYVLDIYGEPSNVWFKAVDVAGMLDYSKREDGSYQTSNMIKVVEQSEISTVNNVNGGSSLFISENGLYRILLTSRKPFAKQVQSTVFQYLREIRKHGVTGTSERLTELANNPDLLIELANKIKEERARADAEKERADKAEEINNEREQRLVKDVINEIQRMPEFKDIKITARVNSLLNGKSKFQSKLKRAWSGSDSGSVYQQTGAADIFEPIWTTCQKHPDGGFYELLYVKGKREEAKAYIVKLLRKDVDAELEHKRSQTLLLF